MEDSDIMLLLMAPSSAQKKIAENVRARLGGGWCVSVGGWVGA